MVRRKTTGARKKKSSGGKRGRSAVTGRYVKQSTGKRSKAGRFADRFIERHPDTFHELSKR